MKKSNLNFDPSATRNKNIERDMFLVLYKAAKPIPLPELKEKFKGRASLETTTKIINASQRMDIRDNSAVVMGHISAHVSYTVTGGDVKKILIDGKKGKVPTGTVSSVTLYGDSYAFGLEIESEGLAAFSFDTTTIAVSDGTRRRLPAPIVSNKIPFVDTVDTVPN